MSISRRVINRLIHLLPVRHQLLCNAWLWQRDGTLGPELTRLAEYLPPERRRTALDIGANNGVTATIFSKLFDKVFAFEADPSLVATWSNFAPNNVNPIALAISNTFDQTTLKVPIVNGHELHGWASFTTPPLDNIERLREIEVQCKTLDSLEIQEEIDFVKIDVEGHESQVLEGGRQLFSKHRPWIVVEIRPENQAKVRQWCEELQYDQVSLGSLLQIPVSEIDTILMPLGTHSLDSQTA